MQLGFWRKLCLCGCWLRRAVLAAALVVIIALAWFNQIGLPDFLKKVLVEKLRDHGIELQFANLRLRFHRGIVAENVRVGGVNISDSPTVSFAEVQLQPDFRALLRGQLQIQGLALRDGKVLWPLSPSNFLAMENIQSELHFGTNDTWSLDNFRADFAGAKFSLSGEIMHARDLQNWEIFHRPKTGTSNWRGQLLQFSDTLADLHYAHPPQLSLIVKGDARDVRTFFVNLALVQDKTRLQLTAGQNDLSQSFRWRVRGAINPELVEPFLTATNAVKFLGHFEFHEPLFLDVNFYGRDFAHFGADGFATATDFTVRDEAVDHCAGDFIYTNRVLKLLQPHLARGDQMMSADEITLDFNTKLIWFKNGLSTTDPEMVANAIGPKVGRLLEPYHFREPPTVRVNGCAPIHKVENLHDLDDADLSFDVLAGTNFECLKFRAQTVTGTVHWLGESLILTNVVAQLYSGSGNGSAAFDFSVPHEGADYQFTANLSKLNLHSVATDLASPTNHLEGLLSGKVAVTRADTRDWRSVNGFGDADLRDGLLWDMRIFGILSPVLNTLLPGANIGSIRATDASGKFVITNGVIYSHPLEIHSTMMWLQYDGHVDLKGNVHADVTAQLLRGTPGVGPIITAIFWPFTELLKVKVDGTLKDPKVEPIHIPKETMLLLHPIKTIQGWLPSDQFFPSTNAPPK